MGFFRRNKQHEESTPPLYQSGQAELVVEVQDGNHEQNRKPKKDQVHSIDEATAADMDDIEQDVEVDLVSFRKVVPEQEEAPTKDSNKRRTKLILLLIALLALIAAIVLAATLTIGGRKDEPTPEEDIVDPIATETPVVDDPPDYSSDDAAYLIEILQVYTPIEVLTDPSVPQGAAFLELLKDEEASDAKTPPLSVEQRYALQVLYLSTSPDGWTNSAGWDTAESDECSWEGVVGCTTTDDNVQAVSSVAIGKPLLSIVSDLSVDAHD
jgi:hypothetical protein